MAITRGIIEEHGGIIKVDSAQGNGTKFNIELLVAYSRAIK